MSSKKYFRSRSTVITKGKSFQKWIDEKPASKPFPLDTTCIPSIRSSASKTRQMPAENFRINPALTVYLIRVACEGIFPVPPTA